MAYFSSELIILRTFNDMETFASKITDRIGTTPLIDLSSLVNSGCAKLYAKCEFMNPGMSLKDRIGQQMIRSAINSNELKEGGTIVCASSGNTGCSVAMLGAALGFKVIVVTSKKCSQEKLEHIKAYGAEIIIADDSEYMAVANQLANENGYFNIDQYSNPQNPQAYYETLGPEIWQQTEGKVTHFVMTGSTFGCISGTGRFLKEQNAEIKVILADPAGSNMHKYFYQSYLAGNPDLELGAMENFIVEGAGKSKPTSCLDCRVIDAVYSTTDQESIDVCYKLANEKGLLVGGSSGLNVHAAIVLANSLGPESNVVTVLCDSGVKYLSKIYNPEFLHKNKIRLSGNSSQVTKMI